MGLLLAALGGAAKAYDRISDKWDDDQAKLADRQAELDKEQRIEEASIRRENRVMVNAKINRQDEFNFQTSPENRKLLFDAKLEDQKKTDAYGDSRFGTKLDQATKEWNATHPYESEKTQAEIESQKAHAEYYRSAASQEHGTPDHFDPEEHELKKEKMRLEIANKDMSDADKIAINRRLADLNKRSNEAIGTSNKASLHNDALQNAASNTGVPYEILVALADKESGGKQFRPDGSHTRPDDLKSTATGLTQVVSSMHPNFDKKKLETDAVYNANAGASILKSLYDKTDPKLPEEERYRIALGHYRGSEDRAINDAYAQDIYSRIKQSVGQKTPPPIFTKAESKAESKENPSETKQMLLSRKKILFGNAQDEEELNGLKLWLEKMGIDASKMSLDQAKRIAWDIQNPGVPFTNAPSIRS